MIALMGIPPSLGLIIRALTPLTGPRLSLRKAPARPSVRPFESVLRPRIMDSTSPLRTIPASYESVSETGVEIPDEARMMRHAIFAWGMRVLCAVDVVVLVFCIVFGNSFDRVVGFIFIWGPPLGLTAFGTLSPPRLLVFMVYNVLNALSIFVRGVSPTGLLSSIFHLWMFTLSVRFYRMASVLRADEKVAVIRLLSRRALESGARNDGLPYV